MAETRQNEFERVAMPNSRSLLRVARRLTSDASAAEDLVQETLLLAWRSFRQFRSGTNARAWLFRILFNTFYGQERKEQTAPRMVPISESVTEAAGQFQTPALHLEAAEVAAALADLAVEHRTVLLLGVVEGFTCQETADILSVPIGTVMSRLSRARKALHERLTGGVRKLCARSAE